MLDSRPSEKNRRNKGGEGILIPIRKNLDYTKIRNLTCTAETVELASIRLNNVQPNFKSIVCYRAPNIYYFTRRLGKIIAKTDAYKYTLFVGQFNDHHGIDYLRAIEIMIDFCIIQIQSFIFNLIAVHKMTEKGHTYILKRNLTEKVSDQ